MKYLINACWVLFAIVVIAQTYHALARKDDVSAEPPPPQYGVIGSCVDISDFIRDVENVNGISCDCIILDGEIIYFDISE